MCLYSTALSADPAIAGRVRNLIPNAIVVHQELPAQPDAAPRVRQGLSPRELYAMYVQERHGFQADESLLEAFDRLLADAAQAESPSA